MPFKVTDGGQHPHRVVLEHAKPSVAERTEQIAPLACGVAMVYVQDGVASLAARWALADGAQAALRRHQPVEVRDEQTVPVTEAIFSVARRVASVAITPITDSGLAPLLQLGNALTSDLQEIVAFNVQSSFTPSELTDQDQAASTIVEEFDREMGTIEHAA